ncbi:ABC transporter permease [Silvibacterium acidisoli]|uniref:ABC transporter permease n=1 Tax=Acidobacteriaceae bacterium ZG23-2 TaxID=2883246 RepID=UPI00406C228D
MLLQDLKFALRQLRSSWGFATLAILTLTLGIGANTAMYTIVENVMLRPMGYRAAERLMVIAPSDGSSLGQTSYLNLRDIHDQAKSFEGFGIYGTDLSVIQGKNGSVSVAAPRVSDTTFPTLGGQPILGRTFTAEEASPGGPHVVLLSEGLWRQQFGADRGVVGRTIKVSDMPYTVIGVMPAGFLFPNEYGTAMKTGIWLPLQLTDQMKSDRGYDFQRMVALRKPDVTAQQAEAEVSAIVGRIRKANPKEASELSLATMPYQQAITGQMRPVFLALVCALVLVLLIACANVSNLLLARCLGRSQEFAVRTALGASRWRMVRQLLSEGALLSLFGATLGIALAQVTLLLIRKLPEDTIPLADTIRIHWTVVLLLAAAASVTTILSSLLPALIVSRTNPQPALQASSRGLGTRSVSGKLSGGLVMVEVALSTLLLIGTGLLFHTFWNLQHVQLGFDVDRVTTFTVMPADSAGFSNMAVSQETDHAPVSIAETDYRSLLDRIRSMPGIRLAALATSPPLSGMNMSTSFEIVGHPPQPGQHFNTRISAVSDEYGEVFNTPILRGRMVGADDTGATTRVAVVNEAFVKKYFSGMNPLDQKIDLGGKETGMLVPFTVVGVMSNQADLNIGTDVQPLAMIPYRQVPTTSLFYQALLKTMVSFTVKTRSTIPVAPPMRKLFKDTAPTLAVDNFATMQENVNEKIFSQRLGFYLTASFAGLAVVMVIAGLYGVLAQLVAYRRHEIGIRMALGATRQSVARMILRQGVILIGTGLVAGMVISLFMGQLVKSFLYHVPAIDLGTYLGVALLLLIIGSVASLVPARAASSIEPMEALRQE